MAKGGTWERDLCRKLSRWWTHNPDIDDDLFWRSSQSGGRATTRMRKGKKSRGHCGDISATDSEGEPLVKLITIEAKVGYFDDTVFGLFDNKGKCGKTWPGWINQAAMAAVNAGTPFWCVIHLRNKKGASRKPLILIPSALMEELHSVGVRFKTVLVLEHWAVFKLDDFLAIVDPNDIKILNRLHLGDK